MITIIFIIFIIIDLTYIIFSSLTFLTFYPALEQAVLNQKKEKMFRILFWLEYST